MTLGTQQMPSVANAQGASKLESTAVVLGLLWIALALWSVVGLVNTYTLYHRIGSYSPAALLFPVIQNSTVLLLKAIVIYTLLSYRSSGRVVAIVVATFNLFMMVLGQASVFYFMWLHSHRAISFAYTPVRTLTLLAVAAIYVYTLLALAPAASGIAWAELVARKHPQNH
jgi:hypothetical protein